MISAIPTRQSAIRYELSYPVEPNDAVVDKQALGLQLRQRKMCPLRGALAEGNEAGPATMGIDQIAAICAAEEAHLPLPPCSRPLAKPTTYTCV